MKEQNRAQFHVSKMNVYVLNINAEMKVPYGIKVCCSWKRNVKTSDKNT